MFWNTTCVEIYKNWSKTVAAMINIHMTCLPKLLKTLGGGVAVSHWGIHFIFESLGFIVRTTEITDL